MIIWKRNLIFLSIAQFTSMIGMSFFLPFIPLYLKELGLESQDAIAHWSGILFSAGFLMLSLVAPLWGSLADRYGRRLMVLRAMIAGSIVLIATAFVQTPSELLVLRLLHGCFSGFVSSAVALIAAETPPRSLGFGLGLFQSTLTAGFIFGPFIGGTLHDTVGIRPAILLGGCLILVGALCVWLFVREENKPKVKAKPHSVWSNASFVFNNETLWPAARIQFLSNLALMSVIPLLVLMVTNMQTDSSNTGTMSGLVISAAALSMMFGAPLWGRIADRWGRRKVLTLCLFATGICFVPQGIATSVEGLFMGRFFLGFFAAGIAPSLQALIAHHSPTERKSGVLGISFSITLMGNAVGPFLGGAMAAATNLRLPFFLGGLILAFSSYLSRHLKTKLIKSPPSTLTQAD